MLKVLKVMNPTDMPQACGKGLRAVSPYSRREDKTGKNEGATGSDSLLLQNASYDNPSLEIRTLIHSEGQNAPDLTPYLVSPSKLKKK